MPEDTTVKPYSALLDTATETFSVDCESRPILDQIANKWSMMCLAVLTEPRRFNEIKRRLEGITQRVLTQTLRRLERDGLIERRVLPTSPVGVEYAITPLGESLREPFGRLYDWTVLNAAAIRSNQAAYDQRTQREAPNAG
ncbi:helix-turn-helix domain-containing protein [Branchiibius sp. NY16-3462-2]|uniref:winged helix-turn-helix transcriptional regulator n=1 Tax=Branchiibius sp. NY16-3462-2 TaxID=1807500 RepID=UPI000795B5F1|nr:helix-turn-helix domain-containing protein [Branchiibius sp. NY16-3462-2]KYH44510.1 HxlR family transcriptional regulator [Branchiibius sp. NY16-3462-2]